MRGGAAALVWACFLGSSWTWVIGMLLPVLLVRDYGVWGWVVFAVPNVIGAAVMGLVLTTPARSRALVKKHHGATLRFSEITVAYHVFVVGAWFKVLFGDWAILGTAAVLILMFMIVGQRRTALIGAVGVTVVSLGLLVAWWVMDGMTLRLPAETRLTTTHLLFFAPASLVGFALCPYLDLTFHRARQNTSTRTGIAAFVIGFGIVFLLMIVFSLWYARSVDAFLTGSQAWPRHLMYVLAIHMVVQAGFTTALHVREIAERRGHIGLHRLFMLAVAAGALAWWALSEPMQSYYGLPIREVIYRVFLLFYGLVFPAYVFLCMIPAHRPLAWSTRFVVFLIATLLAAPMACAGFVAGHAPWIGGGLGVLGLARGAIELVAAKSDTNTT